MIDLSRTRFVITCYPKPRPAAEIWAFIELMMRDMAPAHREYRAINVTPDRTCARNVGVLDFALRSPKEFEHFVFIDQDVKPTKNTPKFLKIKADVVSCQVPMKDPAAWSNQDSFHEALWHTRREVLQAIDPPWFMQRYTNDGCAHDGCICQSFRDKAKAAGFSIAHGGWAEHDQDGSWC